MACGVIGLFMDRHNAKTMQKAWSVALGLLIVAFFLLVLFADFMPMPFGSYATQRFFLVGFLGLVVVFSSAFLIYRDGFQWSVEVLPAAVFSVGFVLLSLPFGKVIMDRHNEYPD